jgi:hypothetical protein
MSREQPPLKKPTRAGNGHTAHPLGASSRNRFCNAPAWRLLWLAVVCLMLAGCSLIGGRRAESSGYQSAWMTPSTQRKQSQERKSLFGSWFRRSEPRPAESIDEFLALERLDP